MMKHRKGIDLICADFSGYIVSEGSRRSELLSMYNTLDQLPEWYVIVGYCPRCRRYGRIERRDIRRLLGVQAILSRVAEFLRCTGCRERTRNGVSLRKMSR